MVIGFENNFLLHNIHIVHENNNLIYQIFPLDN